ncbi:hypothetical protein B0H63DRAFT_387065, partial [Podospora didyma]
YTCEERKWLKSKWGGEFHFLQDHGLSVYEDDDRLEGSQIARTMMKHDDDFDRKQRRREITRNGRYYGPSREK